MAIPHYVNENKSDMRSIKPGWYAMDEDGTVSSGPFPRHEECVQRQGNPRVTLLRMVEGIRVSSPTLDRRVIV